MSRHTFVFSTKFGDMTFSFAPENAPETCANFRAYYDAGYYRKTSFYRQVTPAHPQANAASKISVIQGGNKFDLGGHDPAKMIYPLVHEPTSQTGLRHTRGAIGMGRFAVGETYGGFYICDRDEPALDHGGNRFVDGQGGAVFGCVAKGWDVLDALMCQGEEGEFLKNEIQLTISELPNEI